MMQLWVGVQAARTRPAGYAVMDVAAAGLPSGVRNSSSVEPNVIVVRRIA